MNKTNTISDNFSEILSHFRIGRVDEILPYGTGHINQTFLVKSSDGNGMNYLLQRINHNIFKDVPVLINNILTVTGHLRKKAIAIPGSNPDQEVLSLVETNDGTYYCQDAEGNYWRMYYFIYATSYDILENKQQAYEGGKAFGRFQAQLGDLNIKTISETIPDFHNVLLRLQRFNAALDSDIAGRAQSAAVEIAFVQVWMDDMIAAWKNLLKLPVRVIHNDTKFNNVLLDQDDCVQCVIDLDTVMPGYVAYDFGDAIRIIINTAAEDEQNLEKINLNIPFFKAYVQGYLEKAISFLTEEETESLLTGIFLITYEQIVRFLTDYLENDTYYKTHFPGHNLQRTRAQMQLLLKLEEARQELQTIIKNLIKVNKLISNK